MLTMAVHDQSVKAGTSANVGFGIHGHAAIDSILARKEEIMRTVTQRDMLPERLYRPFAVPDRLDELQGPATGVIELPNRIAWRGRHLFDLADRDEAVAAYSAVLASGREADVQKWINADLLRKLWPHLRIPRLVRREWEHLLDTIPA
ncbi:hypothetical protein MAHJHV61_47610 [Mycobacterium avium subsp. hominissuis]|uniref:Uncharacterized protein n=5 Tax=Mycobacterium TaxID=1763 RepID=A0A2A3L9H7_MYCAV|nr:hypothetical protein XV03_10445 [Mycobacterium avium subsp. hominissuis]